MSGGRIRDMREPKFKWQDALTVAGVLLAFAGMADMPLELRIVCFIACAICLPISFFGHRDWPLGVRWMLSVACVLFMGYVSFQAIKKTKEQPYSAATFSIIPGATIISNRNSPALWVVINNYFKTPANLAVYLRIENLESSKVALSSYTIEGKSKDHRWFPFIRVGGGPIYMAIPDFHEATRIDPKGLLNSVITKERDPRGIWEGWVLLQYPDGQVTFDYEYRVKVTDLQKNSFTSGILESSGEEGSIRDAGLPVLAGKVDISAFPIRSLTRQ